MERQDTTRNSGLRFSKYKLFELHSYRFMALMYHLQGRQEFLSHFEQRKERYFHRTRWLADYGNNTIVYIYSTIIKHVPTSEPLHVLCLLDCSPFRYLQGPLSQFLQACAQRSPWQGPPRWPHLEEHCSTHSSSTGHSSHISCFIFFISFITNVLHRAPPDSWVKLWIYIYLTHIHVFISISFLTIWYITQEHRNFSSCILSI